MQRKIVSAGIIGVLCVLMGSAAVAQGGPQRGAGPGQFMRPRVIARLNLTPEQVKQIQGIAKAHRAAIQPGERPAAQVNIAQERQALMKAVFSDKPDEGEIQKHLDALSQQQTDAAQRRQQQMADYVTSMLEINKVLTPAQRAEFHKMLDENARTGQIRRGRMMQRRSMQNGTVQQQPPTSKED